MRGLAPWLLVLALLAAPPALAQPARTAPDEDAPFIEYLRRQGPEIAERFITLRDARAAAFADLQQASERYNAGGAELRAVSLPQLQQARRRYAEASLALLDFLDGRDREAVAKLEADLERVKRTMEQRGRDRAQMERMLRGE